MQFIAQNVEESDMELMFYIILRGYIRFHNEYSAYPGVDDEETDTSRLKVCKLISLKNTFTNSWFFTLFGLFQATVTKLLNEWNTSVVAREDCIREICRYGGAELPSVAAFMGKKANYLNHI